MAFVPIILMAASAAMAAYGSIQQGKAESANAKSQASAQRYNAEVQTQNANLQGAMASARELQVRRQTRQRLGNIEAGMAEGGGFGGTNAGVLRQDAVNGEMDALDTRYSGILGARNSSLQAQEDIFQSKVSDVNAKNAKTAGYWGAGTALLKGASSIYGADAASSGGSGY